MTCYVAVSSSPSFSPSSSLFCSKSIISPSHEAVTLTLSHLKSSQSSSSSYSSAPSSPSSPFRPRLPKPPHVSSPFVSAASNSTLAPSPVPLSSSAHTELKRKRPARLDIPVASLSLGNLSIPSPASMREIVEVDREGHSIYCKRGRRESMEDRYSAAVDLQGDPKQAFFGVFDGHGGAKAAQFAAENLEKNIFDEIERRDEAEIEQAVKTGYLNTDSDFLKEDMRGGSCCVTALIRKGNLVVSNAGDCRAVISKGGVAEALTSDHCPSRQDERDRIETSGGYVDFCHGVLRIQGSLAVSRGIGDRHLKKWVIAEPETKIFSIESQHEFLLLASDGLWDTVTNQEAVDIVRPLCIKSDKPEPLFACKKLVELSTSRGSADDISVILIQLGNYIS